MREIKAILLLWLVLLLLACGGTEQDQSKNNVESEEPENEVVETVTPEEVPTKEATVGNDSPVLAEEAIAGNDSFASAIVLGNKAIKSTIKESALYYKLDVPLGAVVTGTLAVEANAPLSMTLSLYDMKEYYVNELIIAPETSESLSYIFDSTQEGTIFFKVSGEGTFTLQGESELQKDASQKGDAGDSFEEAFALKLGDYDGLLGGADRNDYYAFTLPTTGGLLELSLQADSEQMNLNLYDSNQFYINEIITEAQNKPALLQYLLAKDQGKRWFAKISGTGNYSLSLSFSKQNDAESGQDVGEEFESAYLIELGDYEGLLGDGDSNDYYTFELPTSGGILSATLQSSDPQSSQTLYDSDQFYINESSPPSRNKAVTMRSILAAGEGESWYLRLNGTSPYSFSLAFSSQNDGASQKDAPAEIEDALPVKVKQEIKGLLGDNDRADAYQLDTKEGSYTLRLTTNAEEPISVAIYNSDNFYISQGSSEKGELELSFDATGESFVRVTGADEYRFVVE